MKKSVPMSLSAVLASLAMVIAVALAGLAAPAHAQPRSPDRAWGMGEGPVTRDAFVENIVSRARIRAEEAFDRFDANNDGVLDVEERRAAARAMRGRAGAGSSDTAPGR